MSNISFEINNLKWTISFVDKTSLEDTIGTTNYETQTIEVLKTLKKSGLKKTIIHELTHAFMWSYGLMYVESYTQEIVCDFMSCYAIDIIELAIYIYFRYETES